MRNPFTAWFSLTECNRKKICSDMAVFSFFFKWSFALGVLVFSIIIFCIIVIIHVSAPNPSGWPSQQHTRQHICAHYIRFWQGYGCCAIATKNLKLNKIKWNRSLRSHTFFIWSFAKALTDFWAIECLANWWLLIRRYHSKLQPSASVPPWE